jgi:hypothetical protein
MRINNTDDAYRLQTDTCLCQLDLMCFVVKVLLVDKISFESSFVDVPLQACPCADRNFSSQLSFRNASRALRELSTCAITGIILVGTGVLLILLCVCDVCVCVSCPAQGCVMYVCVCDALHRGV